MIYLYVTPEHPVDTYPAPDTTAIHTNSHIPCILSQYIYTSKHYNINFISPKSGKNHLFWLGDSPALLRLIPWNQIFAPFQGLASSVFVFLALLSTPQTNPQLILLDHACDTSGPSDFFFFGWWIIWSLFTFILLEISHFFYLSPLHLFSSLPF